MFSDPLVARMAAFLGSIGIPVLPASSLLPANFPGLDIQYGCVLVDESRVVHAGDILHEAGHVAMTKEAARNVLRLEPTGGEELASMAWSYAAAMHLSLGAETVFYPESYLNCGDALIESFAKGSYVGVPLMQAWGMAVEPKNAAARGETPYPHMLRWLR